MCYQNFSDRAVRSAFLGRWEEEGKMRMNAEKCWPAVNQEKERKTEDPEEKVHRMCTSPYRGVPVKPSMQWI